MTSPGAESVGPYFGTPGAPCLKTVPLRSAAFSVTKIDRRVEQGQSAEIFIPAGDAYFLMLYLEDAVHADIEHDGLWLPVRTYERGTVCLVDLRHGAAITLHSDLSSLAFVLPLPLFEEVSQISSAPALQRPRCRRGEPDPVISNLGMALLPLFESEGMSSSAVIRHMAVAVCAHLLHGTSPETNGTSLVAAGTPGSLAAWQEKAAREFMRANLDRALSISTIAAAVSLSPNHFSQQFKQATGLSPLQYLTRLRVDRAKELLGDHSLSVKAVAKLCGFCDHSHFTKVFSKLTGLTPKDWRATNIH